MIKAEFKNIGPIREADLELGDLTIIAGQNNTGKTYLVYTLYGFLNFYFHNSSSIYRMFNFSEKSKRIIREIASQIQVTGTASIKLEEYKTVHDELIEKASKFFSDNRIHKVFNSPGNEFENADFQIKLEKDSSQVMSGRPISLHSVKDNATLKSFFQDENLIFEIDNPESVKSPRIISGVTTLFALTILNYCPKPHILSAERFSISLFYKELDFTKNQLVKALQNLFDDGHFNSSEFLEKQSARYALPIKVNIDFTRDLSSIQKEKNKLTMDKKRSVDTMMDAYYKVKKDEIRLISKRRGDNRFDIPLHLASSSARGLSDLYFYLKHRAEPGQLLIIDEPESHLSPTNQVLMARLLVFCVNAGLKVLITTHSDYIVKEINNLIMLHNNFKGKEKFLKEHKKDYTENDHLDPERVKAYICENGKLKSCDIDKRGITKMTVFDKAINDINLISGKLNMYMALQDD